MSKLIIPTIHLNGTSGRDLLDQHTDAMSAIADAIEKLPHPNGRDYYPQGPRAIDEAIAQTRDWAQRLDGIRKEIEAVAMGFCDYVK